MPKTVKYLIWIFPVLVAAMIFSFSAQTGSESSQLSGGFVQLFLRLRTTLGLFPQKTETELLQAVSILVRKGAHVTEYLILCISFLISFRVSGMRGRRRIPFSWIFTFCYACTDEFHQLFVPGRAGLFTDVLIDSSGALVLCLLLMLWMKENNLTRKKKNDKIN